MQAATLMFKSPLPPRRTEGFNTNAFPVLQMAYFHTTSLDLRFRNLNFKAEYSISET